MTSASGLITYNTALLKYKNALKGHLLKGRSIVSIDVNIIRKISKKWKAAQSFFRPIESSRADSSGSKKRGPHCVM